ncbi:flagellar biosynthesis protein FlhF [Stenotrophomonas sp. W1S232]|uniref:Flagellar biosynthesis protein FlhF n=1 Tax=Stenotrophomonas koreensis TaxID=266128 RepID=A0A7W3YWG6_9GAMM|nr:flagellar biosynthesis protein FlhF [Stenotrophomonas koreensis]MBB1117933.1 flagellar biosynthesis protein FlhF [Stenotrophomonas koreensis]
MKIKRFVAADMRSAMNLVRREHGPDAVILSNRRVENGVEIVAAAHYDESAVQRALQASQPAPAQKPRSAAEAVIAAITRRRKPEAERPSPLLTTSNVAAIARAAVGASGRDLAEPPSVPEATLPEFLRTAALPRAASSETVPAAQPPAVASRAQFVIDPPLAEDETLPMRGFGIAQPVTVSDPTPPPPVAFAPAAVAVEAAALHTAPANPATPSQQPPPPPASPALSVLAGGMASESPQLSALREEMAGMRVLIEREMARFTDERLRGSPVRAQAMDLMDEYGLDAGLARDVASQIPADTEHARARGLMLGLISRKLPIASQDPIRNGGVIALVGPTGAGKTTTIAKLAARFASEHGPRDIALVTTDTRRIGAREQLYGFGRQLGIAVHEAESGSDLGQLLQRLSDYKLVLIDTAGLGQRDRGLVAQLQWLRAAGQIRTLLTLPANVGFQDMDEVVRRFAPARPEGLVLTKLDETGRFGAALSIAVDHQLPITWVADGQDVPADLQRASAANLVLRLEDLRRAADMPSTQEPAHAIA